MEKPETKEDSCSKNFSVITDFKSEKSSVKTGFNLTHDITPDDDDTNGGVNVAINDIQPWVQDLM